MKGAELLILQAAVCSDLTGAACIWERAGDHMQ